MARHKLTREQQIRGCRKALANPRTPKQFLPGLRKRLKKLLAVVIFAALVPALTHAQFMGYTSPQTVQQTLANAVSCTGSSQSFNIINLGQVVHQFTILANASVTFMQAKVIATDGLANTFQISDTAYPTSFTNPSVLLATGYYPLITLVISCIGTGGLNNFTATYAGASSFSFLNQGAQMNTSLNKSLFAGQAANASTNTTTFTPYGSTAGALNFTFAGGPGPSGSTLTLQCFSFVGGNGPLMTFTPATAVGVQTIAVPGSPCTQVIVSYNSGGASAATFSLAYAFSPQGSAPSVSASNLTMAINDAPSMAEKGARWGAQTSTPAAGSQATTSKTAGSTGTRHVADCVAWSAGALTAPAALTQLIINLRDGATGAGTILWQTTIIAPAATGQHGSGQLCGLNLIGSAATAMTLEFSAALANESQSVALTGFDVQ